MNIQITYPHNHKLMVGYHTECAGLVRLPSGFGDGRITLFYREFGKDKWNEMGVPGLLTTVTNPVPVSATDERFSISFACTGFAKKFEMFVRCQSDDGTTPIDSNVAAFEVVKNFQEIR